MSLTKDALRARLGSLTLQDERRLRRRLDRAARLTDAGRRTTAMADVANAIVQAEQRVDRRARAVPAVAHPPDLPITARIADLAATIRDHQVVVVAGETGSGKTTQLPKICLELGRGVRGMIGHTQPRRIAARTVAERVAAELDVPVGGVVGYEHRFHRRIGDDTLIAVLTDGILLAGIQSDPALTAYDTLVIDEAHERSLTIDFLIGYLTRLLPRRPDLKVIVTSATIDPLRFSRHFDDAPVVEVSGRTYPVDVRYRPLLAAAGDADDGDSDAVERDQIAGVVDAVAELRAEAPGDILVFLPGEREIRDTADALAAQGLADTEVLPLYSRLPAAQQRRVFQPHDDQRIVLATNVAETSLTVPGIRYVIDAGTARISRYSARRKVQRLPVEKISQASADQRAGRCGRTSDGICVRLYSEADFAARPAFTEPEILRTNLAAVLLQMGALGLGAVEDFPFLDPPEARQVRDGLALLHELGAVDPAAAPRRQGRRGRRGRRRAVAAGGPVLTPIGRTLSRLPVDPRLGRMLVEADRNACLDEVLVIAAALSIPDPRQRPADAQAAADAAHARFAADGSDFLSWLNLWRHLREERARRSSNQFRKLCRAAYLHHLRVREWQDLYAQLRRVTRDAGMRHNDVPAAPDAIHQSLLAGLLSQIGVRAGDGFTYRGARGATFAIQPGSVLFKAGPQWVMAGELVETSRLWARTVARIQPEWVEQAAPHVVTRTYGDPRWSSRRGAAVAPETVRLYGVTLVADRTVDYGSVDGEVARDLFIRHALVEGDWRCRHAFWRRNRTLIAAAEALEDKLRRDVLADDALFAFYDARVGAEVTSTRAFDRWWKRVRREQPALLDLPWDLLVGDLDDPPEQFPDHVQVDTLRLAVHYRFDPGAASDGVTVDVPLTALHRIDAERLPWLVPGLRAELVTELLRALPKDARRPLVPIPDTARAVLAALDPAVRSLPDALTRAVRQVTGLTVERDAWRFEQLPPHLRMHVRVVDESGEVLGVGERLPELRRRLAPRLHQTLTSASGIERRGLRSWSFGDLPRTFVRDGSGASVVGYPALVDRGDGVDVRVLGSRREQQVATWAGTRRLLLLTVDAPVARVAGRLDVPTKLALATNPHGSVTALLDDALTAVVDELMRRHGAPAWNADDFAALQAAIECELDDLVAAVLRVVAEILSTAGGIDERLATWDTDGTRLAHTDMSTQLRGLVHPGFVTAKSVRRLDDVARYLRALRHRTGTLARDPDRDRERTDTIAAATRAYQAQLARLDPARRAAPDVLEIPWMIEELRVSLFAQSVGTAYRVSPQRVRRAIDDLGG